MKQSPTNELTHFILDDINSRGCFVWREDDVGIPMKNGKLRPGGKKGKPDIISIWPPYGTFVGIEVKTGKDRLRDEQIGFQKSTQHVGGIYVVVHTKEDYLEKLSTIYTLLHKCFIGDTMQV